VIALRPILLLVLCCVLVLSIIHYQQSMNENAAPAISEAIENPESFLDQSLTTEYREDGSVDYQFNSEHLDYFKSTDSALGKTVYFIFFSKDGHTWHTRADQATFRNGNRQIQLNGNVRAWQPARNLELVTDELVFNETREYAETDKPVIIKSAIGTTNSIGMRIDLKDEKLWLLSAVTGTYHVKK